MKTDPLFSFKAPDPSASLEEGLAERWYEGRINITEVANWLVRKGVLTLADRHKPQGDWPYPRDASSDVITGYIRLKRECDVGIPSYKLGQQVVTHLEAAGRALRAGGTVEDFCTEMCRAQDAAHAAYAAGYRDYPIAEVADFTTGLIAAMAEMLREEVMRRMLAGAITPGDSSAALAALSPQARENAAWWRARYGGEG